MVNFVIFIVFTPKGAREIATHGQRLHVYLQLKCNCVNLQSLIVLLVLEAFLEVDTGIGNICTFERNVHCTLTERNAGWGNGI